MTLAPFPPFQVVDLFAGPGGLAEGFASVRDDSGGRPFQIALSIEKDEKAYRTLRFRAFLRRFGDDYPDQYYAFLNGEMDEPDWAVQYPEQWKAAETEALLLELGEDGASEVLQPYLKAIRDRTGGGTIVIGGPPCQAYSIAGRARNKGIADYSPEKDKRHFLYREYISILEQLKPAAFVMENVKGLLSSSVGGESIFTKVLTDLGAIGGDVSTYEFFALSSGSDGVARLRLTRKPKEFVIQSEAFGVPQARHRIIIVGIRRDLVSPIQDVQSLPAENKVSKVTVRDILGGMPALRSGVSRLDSIDAWTDALVRSIKKVIDATANSSNDNHLQVCRRARTLAKRVANGNRPILRSSSDIGRISRDCPDELRKWILDQKLRRSSGHISRGHMESDLGRYFFASVYAEIFGRSPVASEFPTELAPNHKNWDSGIFSDRFRVQVWGNPSTTITSHLAKDGHYFIHPDPMQCRALTIREAARLQTFPDNYRFIGNQTEQFVQVGNAVPPFLARQIGQALYTLLSATIREPKLKQKDVETQTAKPAREAAE